MHFKISQPTPSLYYYKEANIKTCLLNSYYKLYYIIIFEPNATCYTYNHHNKQINRINDQYVNTYSLGSYI